MTNSFLISENGCCSFKFQRRYGALTQLVTERLAIQFVSTRRPPPFFENFAQLAILEKPSLPFWKYSKRRMGSIYLLIIIWN